MATATIAQFLKGCTVLHLTREQQKKYAEEIARIPIRELLAERDLSHQDAFRRRNAMKKKSSANNPDKRTKAELKRRISELEKLVMNLSNRADCHSAIILRDSQKELASLKPLLNKQPASLSC